MSLRSYPAAGSRFSTTDRDRIRFQRRANLYLLARFVLAIAMPLEKSSPCKVNLLLNILGRRPDGFHELETVMQPINLCDRLTLERRGGAVELTCSDASLPADARNLVHRAATAFLAAAKISEGVRIHLEKKIPLAAGLGGGSGNAATTLLALNELFSRPLPAAKLQELAAALGSDVPFFLQDRPARATGRGETIQPLEPFPALRGRAFLLIHPGFGIATPWAYQHLARFPEALNGQPGRAQKLISRLQGDDWRAAGAEFYNALEAPALEKYPVLALFQEFLRAHGALATLMSGSGSTTFAVIENVAAGEALLEKFREKFGSNGWAAVVPV
jgi:4-diphosphocytidyl-2-C-methyl-D-erythritol kinase